MVFQVYRVTTFPLSKRNTMLLILILVVFIFITKEQVLQMLKYTPKMRSGFNNSISFIRDSGKSTIFQQLGSTHVIVFSAYFDWRIEKQAFVRVFALAPRDINYSHISCILLYRYRLIHVPSKVEMLSSHFGFTYAVYNFICDVPKHLSSPSHVNLVDGSSGAHLLIPVYTPSISSHKHAFGVCLPTLFGKFNNSLLFMQSVEMYRILGAGIVTVYNTSVSPTMDNVLRHYAKTGFINIVQWPIDHHLNPSKGWIPNMHPGDIQYYGQIATVNDCLYRNMYNVKYLAMNDIDEIILPRQWSDWASMMEELEEENVAAYYIRMHTFPVNITYKWHLGPGMELWGTDILKQTMKLIPSTDTNDTPTKVLLQPTRIVHHAIHGVLTYHSGFINKYVPDSYVTVQHYKAWAKTWTFPKRSKLMYDNGTLKYSQLLKERVFMMWNAIEGLL